ncbi:hypothetical protein EsHS_00005233 [Epichloe bromicola]
MPGASPPARSGANPAARSQRHSSRAVSGAKSSMISLSIFEANRDGTADANGATQPGVYRSDGKRRVPLSAEGGVYEHDVENEPKRGTAGEGGISITNEGDKSKAKV